MVDEKRAPKARSNKFVSQAGEMEFLSIEEINKLRQATLVTFADEDELNGDEAGEGDRVEEWPIDPSHQITAATLKGSTVAELLQLHVDVLEELRNRKILRSANGPTGDFAEYLFCKCYGWDQAINSSKAFDALGTDGTRYQIKGRRIHNKNKSRQLSAIRDFDGFDMLAAVLFDDAYQILRAALIPAEIVRVNSIYIPHTNSYRFMLRDAIWSLPGVVDATDSLRAVENA